MIVRPSVRASFPVHFIVYYRTPIGCQYLRSFGILGGCGLGQGPLHAPQGHGTGSASDTELSKEHLKDEIVAPESDKSIENLRYVINMSNQENSPSNTRKGGSLEKRFVNNFLGVPLLAQASGQLLYFYGNLRKSFIKPLVRVATLPGNFQI